MPGGFNKFDEEDEIKAENDFLKMKMMLENGADFYSSDECLPSLENEFLKNIMAFEEQSANPVYTTVYKKIDSPTHFKTVHEIADADIDTELQNLLQYMDDRGVSLSCCSPNVSPKELYRFITEELFEHEIDDMDIPGMMNCFIYDEFHPDHAYDNTRAATDDCIKLFFSKKTIDFLPHFDKENIQLNNHTGLSIENLEKIINRFKESYDEINLISVVSENCEINEKSCIVSGKYKVHLVIDNETVVAEDNWIVEFSFKEEYGYWYIINVQLNGIAF